MSFISKKKYFTNRLPNGFGSFYLAKTIHFTASGLLGIFMPIFLYNLFDSNFQLVMVWYLLGSLLYIIIVAYGAQFLDKFGFRKSLQISVILGAVHYSVFYFIDKESVFFILYHFH